MEIVFGGKSIPNYTPELTNTIRGYQSQVGGPTTIEQIY